MAWILVINTDTGRGREALVFRNQREAQQWEDDHPEVSDFVHLGMPTADRRLILKEARR